MIQVLYWSLALCTIFLSAQSFPASFTQNLNSNSNTAQNIKVPLKSTLNLGLFTRLAKRDHVNGGLNNIHRELNTNITPIVEDNANFSNGAQLQVPLVFDESLNRITNDSFAPIFLQNSSVPSNTTTNSAPSQILYTFRDAPVRGSPLKVPIAHPPLDQYPKFVEDEAPLPQLPLVFESIPPFNRAIIPSPVEMWNIRYGNYQNEPINDEQESLYSDEVQIHIAPEPFVNDLVKEGTLIACIADEGLPLLKVSENGYSGYEVEALQFIASSLGLELQFIVHSKKTLQEGLVNSECDISAGGLSPLMLSSDIAITVPTLITTMSILRIRYNPPPSFRDHSIGVLNFWSSMDKKLQKKFDSYENMLKALLSNDIEGIYYKSTRHDMEEFENPFLEQIMHSEPSPIVFALNSKKTQLLATLNTLISNHIFGSTSQEWMYSGEHLMK